MMESFQKGVTRIAAGADIVTRRIQDEEVILQLATGRYYGLDEIGTRSWELLVQEQKLLAEAAEKLAEEYDAPIPAIEADLIRLVEELYSSQLVGFAE